MSDPCGILSKIQAKFGPLDFSQPWNFTSSGTFTATSRDP